MPQFKTAIGQRITNKLIIVIMEQALKNTDLNIDDANLEVLVKKGRDGIKLSKCNKCDYASSYTSPLRNHLKTYTGERPNLCNQCNYASSDAGNLRTHLKTHRGEKPNKCNQCDYASSRADSLRIHMKKHSGEK